MFSEWFALVAFGFEICIASGGPVGDLAAELALWWVRKTAKYSNALGSTWCHCQRYRGV